MVSAPAVSRLLLLVSNVATLSAAAPSDCSVPLLLMVSAVMVPLPAELLASVRVPELATVPLALMMLAAAPPWIVPALVRLERVNLS